MVGARQCWRTANKTSMGGTDSTTAGRRACQRMNDVIEYLPELARMALPRERRRSVSLFCVRGNGGRCNSRYARDIFKPFLRPGSEEQFRG